MTAPHKNIPFSPPYIDQDIIDEVVSALHSGWITTGPKTKEFESLLAKYCGVEKVLCLNSATAGLELMLRWYGVKEGDEVIVPAYTYCATANVVLHCGAKPVLVDVDDNFQMDISEVENAITSRTKAIIPVDIFGYPSDYDSLLSLTELSRPLFKPATEAQKKLGRIMLLVDGAHSVGASYKGQKVGGHADALVFSFHAVKNLTTAEGGAIAFSMPPAFLPEEIYQELNIKSLHGQTKDALAKSKTGGWKYDIVEAGYKFNMPDVLAAIGIASFRKYESFILPRRREIFELYDRLFSEYDWSQLPEHKSDGRLSSCHVYPLRIKGISEAQRDKIIDAVSQEGIAVNVHYQPLPLLSLYSELGYKMADYPKSYDNYSREISLPVYPHLKNEDMEYIANVLSEVVERIYAQKSV